MDGKSRKDIIKESLGSYIRNRVKGLREQKGVSEYKMSKDIDCSDSYVHNFMMGKSLPSHVELFIMCEYFDISLSDFYDTKKRNPVLVNKALDIFSKLDDKDMKLVLGILDRFEGKEEQK